MPKLERLSNGKLPACTWPGAYPLHFYDKQNAVLCHECAEKEEPDNLVAMDINWETADLACDECGNLIAAAYLTSAEQLMLAFGEPSPETFQPDQ